MPLYLITDSINIELTGTNAKVYAEAVYEKSDSLERVIGFIDGTVLGVCIPEVIFQSEYYVMNTKESTLYSFKQSTHLTDLCNMWLNPSRVAGMSGHWTSEVALN